MTYELFASAPRALSTPLAREIEALGGLELRERSAGVAFVGSLETAYRCCLWSRLASRVLLRLAHFDAPDEKALYDGARAIPWHEHLDVSRTFAIDAVLRRSSLQHSLFVSQRVKDAVVDALRERLGSRPSVDAREPDVRLHVLVDRDVASISLDLAGAGLHRRGYRVQGVAAPLKENVAAALLVIAGWPEIAQHGGAFVDPMCGSGTLAIEAAFIAADMAPQLRRERMGLEGWLQHDAELWRRLRDEASERARRGLDVLPIICGYDRDPGAVAAARVNAEAAGLTGRLRIERADLTACAPPDGVARGLVAVNPPYGERLDQVDALRPVYAELGSVLRERFGGWRAAVLTPHEPLAWSLGLRAERHRRLDNGEIESQLYLFELHERDGEAPVTGHDPVDANERESLANRLRKNHKRLGRWAQQNAVTCYRVYDADLPEFAAAIDLYEGWAHVQEYEAPSTIPVGVSAARLRTVLSLIPEVLGIPRTRVVLKVRRRQRGTRQYEKVATTARVITVHEGGYRFLVNLHDYLDTGLFLDHRLTRGLIGRLSEGKRFLNLFAYTGSATVYAIGGGARETTTVDLSNTYVEWALRNFEINEMRAPQHRVVQADCLRFVETHEGRYDLVFVDPPTFSNSSAMADHFDVQAHHADLLDRITRMLAPRGVVVFSTNHRRFRLDAALASLFDIEDLSDATRSLDFARRPRMHQCWKLTRRGGS